MENTKVLHLGSSFINMIRTITDERIKIKKESKQNKL